MSDRYSQIARAPIAGTLVKTLGLPQPVELERWEDGRTEVVDGAILFGAAPGGRLSGQIASVLADVGAPVHTALGGEDRSAVAAAGIDADVFDAGSAGEGQRFKALVFDATGIKRSDDLQALHAFFSPAIRRVLPSGRVIVLGTPPEDAEPREWTAQRALEGFTRSVGKEVRRGATAQLVHVAAGAEDQIASTLWFLLSPKSAYVSAQVIRIRPADGETPAVDWARPLDGTIAVVTGASRGIGEAIAGVLARDGAHVLGVDVPALEGELTAVTERLGGSALALDITDAKAPKQLADRLKKEGGAHAIVHNAGITRDKTLGRMDPDVWAKVIDVNLSSQERIDDELLARKLIRPNGRIVTVSSISGIAGNAGQTNYATSKAGVIGMVQSMTPVLRDSRITINAVAPGFIETQMTAKMPFALREAGRRMNSMSQGGLPVDVAETVAWLASPASAGVAGNVVRVCGQSLLGA